VELLIVVIIVAAATVYVVYTLYRQFTGKGDCGAGCSCNIQLQQQCQTHQYLDNLNFNTENNDPPSRVTSRSISSELDNS
jgi:Tfp pilus assembly protein PilE